MADPVGAIGIQADLATFAAMGCHGLTVITSILIGDTARIEDTQDIDVDWVADQARVVLEDMPVMAFKVGYVGSIESVSAIAEIVSDYPDIPLILDPFITAMPDPGIDGEDILIAIRELLIPQTTVMLLSADELSRLAETWRHGSVVRSWLLDLTTEVLAEDENLAAIAPVVADSGEGRWTALEAIEQGVPAPVMSLALMMRFASQGKSDYADKLLAMMRKGFGGHAVEETGAKR